MLKTNNWTPTPTFLYRNYLYEKIVKTFPKKWFFLDVGCGNGEFLIKLSKYGIRGEGIDTSREAIRIAEGKIKEISGVAIKRASIFEYNPRKKYDVIYSFEVLEHIKDDGGALKAISKLLRKKGVFVMSVPAHMRKWDKIDEIKGHYRRYERKELINKLKSAGLKTETLWTYGFPFLSIVRLFSKSGKLIRSFSKHKSNKIKGRESSIQQEYNPRLKFLFANELLLMPFFKIMDLFRNSDLGFGYVVIARKI